MQENLRFYRNQIPFRHRPRLRLGSIPPLRRLLRRHQPAPPHHTHRNLPRHVHRLLRRRHHHRAALHVQLHQHATDFDQFRAGLGRPVPDRAVDVHPLRLLFFHIFHRHQGQLDMRRVVGVSLRHHLLLPRRRGAGAAAVPADEQLLRVLAGESRAEG